MRSFQSDAYARIENEEIAEVVLPILADLPDVQIVSCELTEARMYIQAVTPRVQADVKVGDPVQAGVIIQNSEIGLGAVSVQALFWRLWCKNGAIAPDSGMKARHIGRRIESSEALWKDDTKKADDRAVLLKVRDTVQAAVDETRFNQRVSKLRDLTEMKITGDPVKTVEVLAEKVGASDVERGGILRSLIDGGDLSAWGLMNAVTAQAHKGDYDRAVEFESAGGALIDLPAQEWKRVLQAA